MDPRIQALLHDDIVREAAQRYALRPDQLRLLDGFESFMYEAGAGDEAFILRLGHDSRRPANLVRGELDFINALAAGGAGVARGLLAASGSFVEEIPDGHGGHFVAAAFAKARGRPAWEVGWTPERYETYGRLVGRMHAISQGYAPANPAWRRPEWNAATMDRTLDALPADEPVVRARYQATLGAIGALPRDASTYGLIHYDAHEGNFFMDDAGRITLFDFDDCAYHWYVCDIAMVLFYKVNMAGDAEAHAAEFLPPFLRGYRAEADLAPNSLTHIPLFLTLREIDLYAAISHDLDSENLSGWTARYMDGRRARIEGGVPYLALDFGRF